MRGRRLPCVLTLVGLAVVVAAGAVVLRPQEDRITQENYDRLEPGMTRAEAVAVLGPADDYSSGPLRYPKDPSPVGVFTTNCYMDSEDGLLEALVWWSDRELWYVFFSPSGRLRWIIRFDVSRVEQTPFENLVWRAERQWHRWFP